MANAIAFVTFGDTNPGVVLSIRLELQSFIEAHERIEVLSRFAGSGVWDGVSETSEAIQLSLPVSTVSALRLFAGGLADHNGQEAIGVTVQEDGRTCVTPAGEQVTGESLWD